MPRQSRGWKSAVRHLKQPLTLTYCIVTGKKAEDRASLTGSTTDFHPWLRGALR